MASSDTHLYLDHQLRYFGSPKPTRLERMHRIAERAVRCLDRFYIVDDDDVVEFDYIVYRLTARLLKGKPIKHRHVLRILREANPRRQPTIQDVGRIVTVINEGRRER